MAVKRKRFWMVWNPEGSQPRAKHYSRESADREAARLATIHPGQEFYVLKCVGGVMADIPPVENFKMVKADHDEIPF